MDTTAILQATAHRPYPLPHGSWIMMQSWQNLLFIHFPIPLDILRSLVPAQIELDTFDGQAWMSIVPFRATHTGPRWLPPPPPLFSSFPEINVRTYVTWRGIPGVYFFSLDASNLLAVLGARLFFHLPYFKARMDIQVQQGMFHYQSQRQVASWFSASSAAYEGLYRPNGSVFFAQQGTLEYWLVERYCLYTVSKKNRLYRVDIHHASWPLQPAEQLSKRNTMAAAWGIELPDQPPLLHFSKQQDVLFWPLQRLE